MKEMEIGLCSGLTRRKIMTDGLIVTFSGFIKMNTT